MADLCSHLPARADLVASDLRGIAAIIEAGARSELSTQGSVLLALASNIGGAILGLRGAVGVETASDILYLSSPGALVWDWLVLRGGGGKRRVPVG